MSPHSNAPLNNPFTTNTIYSHIQAASDFAKKLVSNESGPQLIDVNAALEIFLSANLVREGTAFLLEALKGNKKVAHIFSNIALPLPLSLSLSL